MATIGEVKAQLEAGVLKAESAVVLLRSAMDAVDEAVQLIAGVGEGAGHQQIEASINYLQGARQGAEEVAGQLTAGAEAARNYAAVL